MKFLCVECDEPMRFRSVEGPEEGSVSVTFGCPGCDHRVALLTNPVETQLVRALGVKIGGRGIPPEPLETVGTTLGRQREGALEVEGEEEIVWAEAAEARLQRLASSRAAHGPHGDLAVHPRARGDDRDSRAHGRIPGADGILALRDPVRGGPAGAAQRRHEFPARSR